MQEQRAQARSRSRMLATALQLRREELRKLRERQAQVHAQFQKCKSAGVYDRTELEQATTHSSLGRAVRHLEIGRLLPYSRILQKLRRFKEPPHHLPVRTSLRFSEGCARLLACCILLLAAGGIG